MVNFPGATTLTEAGAAYHLMSVQVRVVEARVEVLVPTETGKCDLWVVELSQQIKNWKVESTRRFRVQRPAPAPRNPYPAQTSIQSASCRIGRVQHTLRRTKSA